MKLDNRHEAALLHADQEELGEVQPPPSSAAVEQACPAFRDVERRTV